ncbi:MAG: tape measure protein [Caulobacter sp.]|nr:tape measure protein [Caulobacter sp.]
MGDEIERLLVRVEANAQQFEGQMKKLNKTLAVTQATNRKTLERMRKDTADVGRRLGTDLSGSLKTALVGSAGVIAASFSVDAIKNFADGYTRYTNQLKVAGLEGERLRVTQDALFNTAQKYGVELESLGNLFGRLTQAGKELHASDADTLRFTNGVAAALKVQGGSADSARGALTQLTQALGGEIVRAEEFSSINEGARPILQAVANGIERYHGSVAALRREVVDGKVTSQEFFQGFLKGSQDLEAQAEKANLTIAASFTVLNNALGKYIGEADGHLSATQKMSQAIQGLANHLDILIPAMLILIGVIGARYAGALLVGAVANARMFAAVIGVTAAISRQTIAMTAAQAAAMGLGRGLLFAFGGPVGLAIAAITVAVGAYAIQSAKARAATEEMNARVDGAYDALMRQKKAAEVAAIQSGKLSKEQNAAAVTAANLTGEANKLTDAHYRQAAAAKAAAVEEARLAAVKAKTDADAAERERAKAQVAAYRANRGPIGAGDRAGAGGSALVGLNTDKVLMDSARETAEASKAGETARKAAEVLAARRKELQELINTPLAKFLVEPTTAGGKDKKGKASKSTGPTPEELARKREDIRLDQAQAVAQAKGDEARVRALEDEAFIRQRTQAYIDAGVTKDAAEKQAIMDRIALRNAEADAAARLYAMTPTSVDTNPSLGPGLADNVEALQAQEDQMRDTFRRTFGEGVRAALRGDLDGFFMNLADRFSDRLIDNLSDQLFTLLNQLGQMQGASGNGNWFTGALLAFGNAFGQGNYAGGYATGGSMGGGQWATVGEKGTEAIYARPGGGVDVISNGALSSLRKQLSGPMPAGGGGTTIIQGPRFELHSPVVTADLLAEMRAQNAASQRQMASQLAKASRRSLPEVQGRQSTLGYIN